MHKFRLILSYKAVWDRKSPDRIALDIELMPKRTILGRMRVEEFFNHLDLAIAVLILTLNAFAGFQTIL